MTIRFGRALVKDFEMRVVFGLSLSSFGIMMASWEVVAV